MTRWLIAGGAVVTVDDAFTVHDPGWVVVDGADIAAVGAGTPPQSRLAEADEVVDASGMAVMPGMVNGHTHLFQTFFRGQADDLPLLDWLRECIWPAAVHLDAEAAYLAAKLGLVENLLTGATSVIDHQYIHIDDAIDDAVCRAAAELGVRFLLARGWADRNYHPPLMESADVVLARTEAVRAAWDGYDGGRIRVELAPLIPWGCSDDAVRATVAAARSWGRGTHIHCAETAVEVEMSLGERGMRHVDWLASLDALGPDVQLAHSVWLDDAELDLVARHGAVVVHCPTSNMYLASGVPRIPEMRRRGIPVALASDGPGSNNRQDLFEALKLSVLLQKVTHLDAMILQPEDAVHMACRGGAAAFGEPDRIGCLAPGRRADLVLVDLRTPFVAPVHRVASALVFSASPANVRLVMVGGRIVVRDGAVPEVDLPVLMAEAEAAAGRVFAAAGVPTRLKGRSSVPVRTAGRREGC
jgi:5-methylthioadenosine/S-adenosylhomocysteine deaminase